MPDAQDELNRAVEQAHLTLDRLLADRSTVRAFDPRLAGSPATFDPAEAEAIYTAAIDAARLTLDTLRQAADRAAHSHRPSHSDTDANSDDL